MARRGPTLGSREAIQGGDMTATQAQGAEAEQRLYRDFAAEHLSPLWTAREELMPFHPAPKARPHVWRWSILHPLAERAADLVPVGRGGERRAIALANPGFGGLPYATPTLWAAIQYLGPGEEAPEHRHTQNAFRFVVEGEGVWTVVDGDPVAMRRGDFLLTPGWSYHGHHNTSGAPMAWLDGLDIPFVHGTDSGFFEFGPDQLTSRATPAISRSERLWAHPGVAEPGHAAVRFTNPATGDDVMPTIRAEFHRLTAGTVTATRREVGSSVWQVFTGSGTAVVDGTEHGLGQGDLLVVPSWSSLRLAAGEGTLDLFRFCDTPIFERLHQDRVLTES